VGDVHETSIEGFSLAWKRMIFKRKVNLHERKEIEILKKLSHVHMIQLVGTYTHRQHLGILLYPVALCDLSTFLEDVEEHCTDRADDIQTARLTALGYFETLDTDVALALPIYTQIGCLVSAISYLHSQKIRHKDLKPSNILLSPKSLYLSDFGTATDFSLLSESATDNERGTPRYYAPEVRSHRIVAKPYLRYTNTDRPTCVGC
jgi:serine/threonine protein kinase